jgi:hypothetical protein
MSTRFVSRLCKEHMIAKRSSRTLALSKSMITSGARLWLGLITAIS